jgi:hypothetical protein
MKKFIIIFTVFYSFNAHAENLSIKILDLWFDEGSEVCADADYGEFLLKFNPIKIMDITNDGIDDYILEEISGRCENSHSYFAGGTGGNHNRVYINPTIENFKFDNYVNLFTRGWKIIDYKGKIALEIIEHGNVCDVAGYIGCVSKIFVTPNGIELLEGPVPKTE